MNVVLDANVLFRIIISGGEILDIINNSSLMLFAPKKLLEELITNINEIVKKSKLSTEEIGKIILIILMKINWVSSSDYKNHILHASIKLAEHEKDIDFVALALSKSCKIWTYEKRIFEIGLGITTKEISKLLN